MKIYKYTTASGKTIITDTLPAEITGKHRNTQLRIEFVRNQKPNQVKGLGKSILLGGAAAGILSIFPVVNLLNLFFMLWIVLGSALDDLSAQQGKPAAEQGRRPSGRRLERLGRRRHFRLAQPCDHFRHQSGKT